MNSQVLIVGAGPTGLALANVLAREGISFRLVDKAAAPSPLSRALGVQAGTLEAVEDRLGAEWARRLVEAGRPARAACFHVEDAAPVRVDLSTIPGPFNYILILSQAETERILTEALPAGTVERGIECVALREDEVAVTATLRGPSGEEDFRADYVVGCDGAHSLVRHAGGFAFEGASYHGDFLLGDVNVDWNLPHGAIRTMISGRGALVAFPMKGRGENFYRIIAVLVDAAPSAEAGLSLEELQRVASELCPVPITLSDPAWLSRFRVHHRVTDSLRRGRLFLAGDAAHIHSPAGGQGMNTGIQDAFNLGFRLARVLQGKAPMEFLDGYQLDRLPVARAVVRGTDSVFRIALAARNPAVAFFRRMVMPTLLANRSLQRLVVRAISEVKVARKEIAERRRFDGI